MVSETTLPQRYQRLRNFLAQQNWQASDRETRRLMLEIVGKDETSYWDSVDYENFPCQDLEILDRLWVNHSQGRFGFSVQKRIYESLGAIPNRMDSKLCEKFGDRLGWRSHNDWFYYNQLRFSLISPIGQLPYFGVGKNTEENQQNLDWEEILFQAIKVVNRCFGIGQEVQGELLLRGGLFWVIFYNKTLVRCNLLSEQL